ncbi:FAD-binding 9 siderophore-interacting domain protein [Rhizobium sp. CF080]|uniref:siderophore-interacting protein n=1 Tax=Rhizobium sp. (strain CF080) TaxID=1144310 RepID=UPI0002715E91|nr:siderophore-interacting protein [Rhizobium sp. CF080]EUB99510.1 FAD-binding 9 siderophore-interacting domain protein [Rhizobium sp. CF080]
MLDSNFFQVTVARKTSLSAGMLRLTFVGDELERFRTTGMPDEYLRLFFPDEETGELVLPMIDADGRWSYREGKPPVRCSTYTVRRFDRSNREIDIDFVVHQGGVASDWAQQVGEGEPMVINNPRGLYTPPHDLPWQVVIADATGIPAATRLLEQKPRHLICRVVIEVACEADIQPLPEADNIDVTWIVGSGNGHYRSRLGDIFPALPLPAGPGHIWAAGEQETIRQIRKFAKNTLKLPPDRHKLVAYWIDENTPRPAPQQLDAALRESLAAQWGPRGQSN